MAVLDTAICSILSKDDSQVKSANDASGFAATYRAVSTISASRPVTSLSAFENADKTVKWS
jgi:hypothetical protein